MPLPSGNLRSHRDVRRSMTRLLDRRTLLVWLAAFVVVGLAGCGAIQAPSSSPPSPSGTVLPGPTGAGTLTAGELRLLLIDRLGPRWYCDPDEYPVAHGTEQERAIERYAEMVAEHDLFTAVAKRLGIDPAKAHTDAEKQAIYHLWKVALSIPLEPIGSDRYRFDYLAQPVGGAAEGTRTAGIVDAHGSITIEQQAAAGEPVCPICLDRLTTIDTPNGPIEVDRLRLGDAVWTLARDGRRVEGTVIAMGSTPAPRGHQVIRIVLADGRSVTASPGHPLADGRTLADVREGDEVDGSIVTGVETLPYAGDETFDLAVSGETGTYFAGGIPLGSTLD